jgi:oleandomycin transport system permease protein
MHELVRIFAEYQPVSVVSDAARSLASGAPAEGAIAGSILWIAGLTLGFGWLAVRAYRRP